MTDDTTPTHTRDIPAPGWKVLKTDADAQGTRTTHHVKLGRTHVARQFADEKGNRVKPTFVEVDYVRVQATRKQVQGTWYQETAVTASDEDGNDYGSYLFFALRALSLDEALFSIGEV